MAVNLSPIGGVAGQFFDNNGDPLTGGKIFTYAAGTTTPQVTYTTSGGGTPHSNPIILDAAGRVPGGEIWLTDGLQYKFVIKTSTDVQIGSYDNVIGINSNFVNYTNAQEIQTATAGQTVFTLTTMQYQPGTNSLSVFVDGVNQYGPGNLYAYEETSATVVTFASGLHVGAEVKFTTSSINASSYGDAEQISYTPPFVGSVTTNVEVKLAQTVSVKDFGAVGDGVADDTAAFAAALLAVSGSGVKQRVVYAPPGKYRLTSKITIPTSVKLQGLNWLPNIQNGLEAQLTSLYIDWGAGADNHAVEMSDSSAIEGFTFYYPGQVAKNVSPPIQFGYSISTPTAVGVYDNISIKNISLLNSYKGIRINNGGRFRIDQVQGEPIYIGFTCGNNFDVCYMNGVHFWPFYTSYSPSASPPDLLGVWKMENATAFEFFRVDQIYVTNCFAYGYNYGFHVRDQAWANFTDILTDTVNYPFRQIDSSRVRLENFEFIGSSQVRPAVWWTDGGELIATNGKIQDSSSVGFQIEGSSGTVLIDNVAFAPRVTSAVVSDTGPSVKISNCKYTIPPFGANNVTVDGLPLPAQSTAITLPSPTIAPTAITGGYEFDFSTGAVQTLQYNFASIVQRNSLYVLSFDYELPVYNTLWYYNIQIQQDVGGSQQVNFGNLYPLMLNTTIAQPTCRVRVPFFANFGQTGQVLNITITPTTASPGASLKLTNITLHEQENKLTVDAQVAMMMKQGYNNDAFNMGQTLMAKGKNRIVLTQPEAGIGRTTEVPTTGTWAVGDEVRVYSPVSGGYIGYVCTTAGTPGTWKAFGAIA